MSTVSSKEYGIIRYEQLIIWTKFSQRRLKYWKERKQFKALPMLCLLEVIRTLEKEAALSEETCNVKTDIPGSRNLPFAVTSGAEAVSANFMVSPCDEESDTSYLKQRALAQQNMNEALK